MRILERNKKNVYYCVRQNKKLNILIDNQGNIIQNEEGKNIIVINDIDTNEIYDVNDYVEVFSKPQKVKLSFLPLAVNGEITELGNEYSNKISIYTTKEFAQKIHNGDRFFIFKEPPEEYDRGCTTADYYVSGKPSIYLTEATIYLRRMTGDGYGENY